MTQPARFPGLAPTAEPALGSPPPAGPFAARPEVVANGVVANGVGSERVPQHHAFATGPYRRHDLSPPLRRRRNARSLIASHRELIALAGFAVLYHMVFGLTGFGGYGAAAFFVAAGGLVFLARRKVRARPMALAMGAALVVLAARVAYAPSVLSGGLATGALVAFGLSMWRRDLHVTDTLAAGFAAPAFGFVQLEGFIKRIARSLRAERAFPVIVAAVVAGAVGLVFATVFAFANPVVAQAASYVWRAVAELLTPAIVGRLFATGATMFVGVALMRPLLPKKRAEYIDSAAPEASTVFRMAAVASLVVVNVLFASYDVLDAVILVGGRPPTGVTTQDYAHQGVAWLTVALSLATTTLSFFFRESLAVDPRAKVARRLAFAWVVESLVLAGFALERVRIHIKYSGLSDLRFVALLGIITAMSGLVLVAHKIRARRTFMWLVRRQIDAFAVGLALYAVTPTHALSARLNVARIERGDLGPLVHIREQALESESALLLLPLLDHSDARVRAGVAFALHDKVTLLDANKPTRWSEHSLSDQRVRSAFLVAGPRITALSSGGKQTEDLSLFNDLRNERAWDAANARY